MNMIKTRFSGVWCNCVLLETMLGDGDCVTGLRSREIITLFWTVLKLSLYIFLDTFLGEISQILEDDNLCSISSVTPVLVADPRKSEA